MYDLINKEVEKLIKVNITGDITPFRWRQWLKKYGRSSGKEETKRKMAVDHAAIAILAMFLYWYRPTIVKDEHDDLNIQWKQKFRADKLQKSYQAIADLLKLCKHRRKLLNKFA